MSCVAELVVLPSANEFVANGGAELLPPVLFVGTPGQRDRGLKSISNDSVAGRWMLTEFIPLADEEMAMTGTVVEVEIPINEFALRQTVSKFPSIDFEIERAVAHDADRVMPFIWVQSDEIDRDEFETVIGNDPSLEQFDLIADLDEEWLYRMEWITEIEALIHILVEEQGTILSAVGSQAGWNLRILFADRDALSRTFEYCKTQGLTFNIINIYQFEEGREGRLGLTEEQQDTLISAFEAGYFDIPREANAEKLAADLGISHQAVSERLRRGYANLIQNTLIIGEGAGKEQSK
ncbi:helix-turn-helix domain-containing protein [Haladaptatus caseinilyticus]|uniref:helix-turn-helix domain-containing protein n=1 Tax=Haladaptatus caseinilyticus TaxID=2993314 RepID=UPI00224B9A13|nr:helix-turn-helix domain-containing protein [Haladaptatus caseinilyticus]